MKELACFILRPEKQPKIKRFYSFYLGPFTHILCYFYVIKPNLVSYSFHFTKIIKYVLTWQIRGILCNSISNTLGGRVCLKTFRSSCGCPHTKRALLRCSTPILCSPETISSEQNFKVL